MTGDWMLPPTPGSRMDKQARRDFDRILGPSIRSGREPTELMAAEAMMTSMVRQAMAQNKFSIKALRQQFGGLTREATIRKTAKALGWYMTQMAIVGEGGRIEGVTIPPGMRETFEALRGESVK
jgi:hypothetical protein